MLLGFNVVILAFWLASGAADMALAWNGIPEATKQATAKYAHSRGAILMVSAGIIPSSTTKLINNNHIKADQPNLLMLLTAGASMELTLPNGRSIITWMALISVT